MPSILIMLLVGGLLLLLPAFQGEAAISVYIDEESTVHFTDAPTDSPSAPLPAVSLPPDGNSVGGKYADLINRVVAEVRVDLKLVKAIIKVESDFDAFAISQKGAQGLMRLMHATADRYAVADVFDPEANIRGGARYLRDLQNMFPGQLSLAVAAYNAGENIVLRYNRIPPYPETRQYIRRVLDLYGRNEPAADKSGGGPPISALSSEADPAVTQRVSVFRKVDADGISLYTNLPPLLQPSPRPTR